MARSIWSGSISFGLVNIPVKLMSAVKDKDVKFHLLHKKDGSRIKNKRECTKCGEEIEWKDLARGYSIGADEHVVVTEEELEALDPKSSRTIDIADFVDMKEIDPAHFDNPYYLVPDERSVKPYGLLLRSLKKSGKVGIARMVMRDKEYLVALRAKKDILLLETMRYAEELVPVEVAMGELSIPKEVDNREVAMAEKLIDTLSGPFDPDKYTNEYRAQVLKLIDRKEKGGSVVASPQPKVAATASSDLMEALKKSLEEAKKRAEVRT